MKSLDAGKVTGFLPLAGVGAGVFPDEILGISNTQVCPWSGAQVWLTSVARGCTKAAGRSEVAGRGILLATGQVSGSAVVRAVITDLQLIAGQGA